MGPIASMQKMILVPNSPDA